MSDYIPFVTQFDLGQEEYSIENEIKEIHRQPLIDILVALMLINDIFLFLRHKI